MGQERGNSVVNKNDLISTASLKTPSQRKKSHQCSQCNYSSLYASKLKNHINKHQGDKANKCNQCNFASSWAAALRSHLKIHSGEKKYICNQCEFMSIHGGTLFLKTDNGNSTWGSEFKLIKTVFKYCVFIFTHVFLQLVQG